MGFSIQADKLPLTGFTIMLNPGHGVVKSNGKLDTGAVGRLANNQEILESDLNDAEASNIRKKLEALGATVFYADKMTVKEIKELENSVKPDLFLSIHQNAHDNKSYRGENVYAVNEESKKVACAINSRLKADKTIPNNTFNPKRSSELGVIQANDYAVAVLVEIGYISNIKDLKIINSSEYQDASAKNIVDGIVDFFLSKRQEKINKERVDEEKMPLTLKQIPMKTVSTLFVSNMELKSLNHLQNP